MYKISSASLCGQRSKITYVLNTSMECRMMNTTQNRRLSSVGLVVYEVIQFCWLRKSAAKHGRWLIYRVTNVQGFTAYKLGPEQGDCSGTLLTDWFESLPFYELSCLRRLVVLLTASR
jgi:hypothetical protein